MSQRNFIKEQVHRFVQRTLAKYLDTPHKQQIRGAHVIDRYSTLKKLSVRRGMAICYHYDNTNAAEQMREHWNEQAAVLLEIRAFLWLNGIGVNYPETFNQDLN